MADMGKLNKISNEVMKWAHGYHQSLGKYYKYLGK